MRENAGEQYDFDQTHTIGMVMDMFLKNPEESKSVSIAGRLLSVRGQGKISFGDIYDETGSIQVIASQETTPDYEDYSQLKVGDWIGVVGNSGMTKRGQPSIFASDWARLAKTEVSFPDKHHGLTDPDTIYRQRYLDLIVNRDSLGRFKDRSKIISFVRNLLESEDFMEVETPILQPLYGGAAAKPFETHHNALDMDMYLRIAPELYLKRLVVGGLSKVFEIGKVFRNEGISTRHNPEFTMMEAYAAYWDYEGQMNLTERVVSGASELVNGSMVIEYQGKEVDLTPPWTRETIDNLVSNSLGDEVSMDTDLQKLRLYCDKLDIHYSDGYGKGKLLLELYEKLVESNLWGPIFVTDYPEEVSPLARSHRSRSGYTERFEGIVAGRELCNGYTELNNPRIQYERFKDQESSKGYDDEAMSMDHDYIRALQYGLPPTAGLGIGIDRLVMLLTNAASIRDVVLFPTLRPDGFTTSYET